MPMGASSYTHSMHSRSYLLLFAGREWATEVKHAQCSTVVLPERIRMLRTTTRPITKSSQAVTVSLQKILYFSLMGASSSSRSFHLFRFGPLCLQLDLKASGKCGRIVASKHKWTFPQKFLSCGKGFHVCKIHSTNLLWLSTPADLLALNIMMSINALRRPPGLSTQAISYNSIMHLSSSSSCR